MNLQRFAQVIAYVNDLDNRGQRPNDHPDHQPQFPNMDDMRVWLKETQSHTHTEHVEFAKAVADFIGGWQAWEKDYTDGNHCGLCGNYGVIDTRGIRTAAGVECGIRAFCMLGGQYMTFHARKIPSRSPDQLRAVRREKRRESMSPAEKERFDCGVRPWSDLAQARRR